MREINRIRNNGMSEQQTLQQLLTTHVEAFVNSEKPAAIIDKGVEKLFNDLIEDAFRSYGDLAKVVKEAIKAAMPANVGDMIQLAKYNDLIAKSLKARWEDSCAESHLLTEAGKAIDEILIDKAMPAEISLNALIEAFIEENKEEAVENQWEYPDVRIAESEYGGYHIYFDKQPKNDGLRHSRERSQCDLEYAIHVNFRDGSMPDAKGNSIGEVYSAKVGGDKIREAMTLRSATDRMIAALYFGNSRLVIDCVEGDFSYGIHG
jgi:hypothetical protein